MTTQELLQELKDRGLRPVRKRGRLALAGDREAITPTLLAVLRWHEAAILGEPSAPAASRVVEPAEVPTWIRQAIQAQKAAGRRRAIEAYAGVIRPDNAGEVEDAVERCQRRWRDEDLHGRVLGSDWMPDDGFVPQSQRAETADDDGDCLRNAEGYIEDSESENP